MTIHEAQQRLLFQLYDIYDDREAASIADWVMEHLTGWKKIDRILHKKVPLSQPKLEELESITTQLMQHRPVHYILHQAWFYGMKLYVDENVLIPRPETEELVDWAINSWQLLARSNSPQILDVGTGSGCIPIALKKKLPQAKVSACDISEGALKVAAKNASEQGTEIALMQLDFLDKQERDKLAMFDVIVSNPPYISVQERSEIDKHVVEYEPHTALFVPDDDSLVFYEHLADFGLTHLHPHGFMMMEIHYLKGEAVKQLFEAKGYSVELKQDMQGKDRMIRVIGQRP
ncbi:MAG TPA: peptide chain release factor N(5)-glutamine methyltransferase [Chitinophagaceae bacterium]|nr:peptide chain release factor N(5)-glutamine methyltransferase [Chitinophagaceae bacterium]